MMTEAASIIYTLGPQGTFSDEAARLAFSSDLPIHYTRTFQEAVLNVSQQPGSVGVVPVENSVAGTIAPVQDALVSDQLRVIGEVIVPVRYALLLQGAPDEAQTCYAHPQAYEQTSQFLAQHLPHARCVFSDSNVDSGVRFLDAVADPDFRGAAVVPTSFADKYPDRIFQEDIQDYSNNTTRFLVVRRMEGEESFDFTRRKTSIFVELHEDRSGLLYELLSIFQQYGINLCRLESRPSKTIPWAYVFYVDFYNTTGVTACLESLIQSQFRIRVLGSYDQVS